MSRFEIAIHELVIENEIGQGLGVKDVASTYALALRSSQQSGANIDWERINKAIVEKWGTAKLLVVKTLAWDYVEGRKEFGS